MTEDREKERGKKKDVSSNEKRKCTMSNSEALREWI